MDLLTQKDLKTLAKEHEDFCISIFMDSDNTRTANLKNKTKLKNLLDKARVRLASSKLTNKEIDERLAKGYQVINDDSFWEDGFPGFCLFLVNKEAFPMKLPFVPSEEVTVSHYFNLVPILIGTKDFENYYVLVVDEGGFNLFKTDGARIEDITPKELKETEREFVKNYVIVVEEEQFYHVENRGGRNRNHEGVIFHGHGNAKDDRKLRAKEFFRKLEKQVKKNIVNSPLPLILVTFSNLTPIFLGFFFWLFICPP